MGTQGPPDLTRRERLALTLMLQQCTAAEIGEALDMSGPAARSLIARVTRQLAEAGRATGTARPEFSSGVIAQRLPKGRRLH